MDVTSDSRSRVLGSQDHILAFAQFLESQSLVSIGLVCKSWLRIANLPVLWQALVAITWWEIPNARLRRFSRGDYKRLYIETPHVLREGVYVLKVTYHTPGMVDRRVPNSLSYYRYLLFLPRGRVLYALLNYSPETTLHWFRVSGNLDHVPGRFLTHFHYGQYSYKQKYVKITVHNGAMNLRMRLSFPEEFHNKILELEKIKGDIQDPDGTLDTLSIPSPSSELHYHPLPHFTDEYM